MSVGNFAPIFIGLFGTIMAYRFIIRPIVGGQAISGIDSSGTDRKVPAGNSDGIKKKDPFVELWSYDWKGFI